LVEAGDPSVDENGKEEDGQVDDVREESYA